MLRDYEILFIVRPELDDEQVGKAVETVSTLIQNLGGEPQKTDVWGRRRLAYEVSHLREGHYVLTDFRLDPERVTEMEATLKISDTVFRHLITRKPELTQKAANGSTRSAPTAAAEPAVVEEAEQERGAVEAPEEDEA